MNKLGRSQRFPGMSTVLKMIGELINISTTESQSVLKHNNKSTTLIKLRRTRSSPSYKLIKRQDSMQIVSEFDPFNLPLNFHFHWLSCIKTELIRSQACIIFQTVISLIYSNIQQVDPIYHDYVRQCIFGSELYVVIL